MRKVLLLPVVFLFLLSSSAFGQNGTPVPDLSSVGWRLIETETAAIPVTDGDTTLGVQVLVRFYENGRAALRANVVVWNGTDILMVYGSSDNDRTVAIKVDGQWYGAKEKGVEQISITAIKRPNGDLIGINIVLDTTDGTKTLLLGSRE